MFMDKNGNITTKTLINLPDTDYDSLAVEARKCNNCHLRQNCRQVVMGEGNINNNIIFIGEAPGATEDKLGRPFVGRAGKLLNKMLAAVNINREEIYITNVVKCRPPDNRTPQVEEMKICSSILRAEIKIINPKVIILLGSTPLKYFIKPGASITRKRGKWIKRGDYYILPTFHPAHLLRNSNMKKYSWKDFKIIKKAITRIQELKKEGAL